MGEWKSSPFLLTLNLNSMTFNLIARAVRNLNEKLGFGFDKKDMRDVAIRLITTMKSTK